MKKIIFILLLLIPLSLFAQQKLYVRGDIIFPGIHAEYNFTPKHSIVLSTNFIPLAGFVNKTWKDISITNFTYLQYRYYFNLSKRQEKGLSISNNAGNYLYAGIAKKLELQSLENHGAYLSPNLIHIGWGFHRHINSHFYYGGRIGLAVPLNADRTILSPSLDFKFGYLLFSKAFNKKQRK